MPPEVLRSWLEERSQALLRHGIDTKGPNWRAHVNQLKREAKRVVLPALASRWHELLDAGHGSCVLRDPELAKIVSESLDHFDGTRYMLLDFVVMPNQVHLLAVFPNEMS